MAEERDNCGNCLYWLSAEPFGYCHRRSPVKRSDGLAEWPMTSRQNWCGDHFKKLPPEVAERLGVDYPRGAL